MRVLINGMQGGNQSGTGRYTEELIRHLAALERDLELTVWWPSWIEPGVSGAAWLGMPPGKENCRKSLRMPSVSSEMSG